MDLVDVVRMERALASRWSERFLLRVFSVKETATCMGSPSPAQAFAARFAAKEAVAKALGTGFASGIRPDQILVQGGERNRPAIALRSRALEHAQSLSVKSIHLSLTHTPSSAAAFVVLEA